MGGKAVGILFTSNEKLLASACSIALAMGCLASSPTSAATYLVANDTQLRQAITDANADGDSTATIMLSNDFAVTGGFLPIPSKAMTIDTQGFTLTGGVGLSNNSGNTLTFTGSLTGSSAGPAANAAGGIGLSLNFAASAINYGSITGGNGGGAGGGGGLGTQLQNSSNLVNNGTITGGTGIAGVGGTGARVGAGSTLTNNSLVEGGNSLTAGGGIGVDIGTPTGNNTLVNNGTIRGGSGPVNGGSTDAAGVLFRVGTNPLVNTGTIEGGAGGVAIAVSGNTVGLNLVNSGTIRAGTGQADAIRWLTSSTTGTLTLEQHAGRAQAGRADLEA